MPIQMPNFGSARKSAAMSITCRFLSSGSWLSATPMTSLFFTHTLRMVWGSAWKIDGGPHAPEEVALDQG